MILYYFLTHLAIGIVLSLLFVSREAGVRFFRFNAGLAAALIAGALAFRPELENDVTARVGLVSLVVVEVALVVYWATVGRVWASIRPTIVAVASAGGLLTLVSQALALSASWDVSAQVLTIASMLSSAVLLGGACTAMILGHWYLVIPSLEVRHLQALTKLHIASIMIRIVVVSVAVFIAIVGWEPGLGPSFSSYIFSVGGIFFWQRVLFGLAGPGVLAYLTWETAKIRSTQSATGILYVDFFMVVVGELLAKYLVLATRVPV